jgi:hypothetical protein
MYVALCLAGNSCLRRSPCKRWRGWTSWTSLPALPTLSPSRVQEQVVDPLPLYIAWLVPVLTRVSFAPPGAVLVWGSHADGKLGLGDGGADQPAPHRLESFGGLRVVGLAAGADHTAAITEDGGLWLWGFGQVTLLFLSFIYLSIWC